MHTIYRLGRPTRSSNLFVCWCRIAVLEKSLTLIIDVSRIALTSFYSHPFPHYFLHFSIFTFLEFSLFTMFLFFPLLIFLDPAPLAPLFLLSSHFQATLRCSFHTAFLPSPPLTSLSSGTWFSQC